MARKKKLNLWDISSIIILFVVYAAIQKTEFKNNILVIIAISIGVFILFRFLIYVFEYLIKSLIKLVISISTILLNLLSNIIHLLFNTLVDSITWFLDTLITSIKLLFSTNIKIIFYLLNSMILILRSLSIKIRNIFNNKFLNEELMWNSFTELNSNEQTYVKTSIVELAQLNEEKSKNVESKKIARLELELHQARAELDKYIRAEQNQTIINEQNNADLVDYLETNHISQENNNLEQIPSLVDIVGKRAHTRLLSKNVGQNISKVNTDSTQISKLKKPQIKLKDNSIRIVLPSNANELKRWEIQVTTTRDTPETVIFTEKEFYILEWNTLSVSITDVDFNIAYEFDLWHENSRKRLIIFSEAGDFIYSGSFGDGEIQLETGKYTIFSRFKYSTRCKEIETAVYMSQLNLIKGKIENISNGFVTLIIKSDSSPSITWNGINIKSNEGHEVFASKDLQLIINLDEKDIYILKITSSLGKDIILDIDGNSSQFYKFDIANKFNEWKSGLAKLTAVLLRKNNKLELAKSHLFLWNELDAIDSELNFYYSSVPSNLNESLSKNILLVPTKLTYLSKDVNQFSFGFDLPLDKILTLTYKTPELVTRVEAENAIFSGTRTSNFETENIITAKEYFIAPIIPEDGFTDNLKELPVTIITDENTDKFEGMF